MSDKKPQPPGADADAPDARSADAHRARRRRRRRKAGLWSLLSMAALSGALALVVLSYLGTPIVLPDWLRARITERINSQTGAMQVELGQMVVVIEKGWTPRLALRAVTLRGADRRVIATLGELGGTFALRPLLQGQVQPGGIRLSGLQVHLRRDDSGSLGVQLGADMGMGGGAGRARDVPSLIAQIDAALGRPALASLDQVRADNMTLRYEDARTGRAWTVDGGKVAVTRESGVLRARGDFTVLGARSYPSTLEFNFSSRIGSTAAQLGLNFSDLPAGEVAMQSPALTVLDALDAPISGALRARLDAQGRLGPLNATLQIGRGVLQPNPATKPIAFEAARAYFTYDPVDQKIEIGTLSIDSKWVKASAEGTAHLIGGADGWPDELQAQLRVSDITADPADLYDAPVHVDSAALDLRLRLNPFHLSLGQLSLSDQGRHLVLDGELRGSNVGWDLALDGRLDGMGRARLLQLWPEAAVPNTRRWVDENVQTADLRDIDLAVRVRPQQPPQVALSFDFAGLDTRFMKQMPMIEGMSGKAVLVGNRFAIEAEAGRVKAPRDGFIDIAGTSFVVPDIDIKGSPAEVAVRTASTITAALSLIDQEPFRFLTKQGRPVTLAQGRAEVAADLGFPLVRDLKTEDVRVAVAGHIYDMRSDVLVPGRILTSDKMELRLADGQLRVGGEGQLDGVPFDGHWTAALGPDAKGSRVDGTILLSQGFADAFGIGLPPGSFTGSAPGQIRVDLGPEGAAEFTLTSDLAGLGLSLPQLNWRLGRDTRGALEVRGRLGTPPQIDRLSLNAPGLNALGSVTLTPGGQLGRALFSRVRVGGWLDAPVALVGRGKGAAPRIEVTGGTIDLRQADLSGGGAGANAGGPVALALDRLTVTDTLALTAFRANLDLARGVDGSFTGRVNGGAPIRGQIVPQAGRSAFRITTGDAGGVLGAAGLLKQARGGEMELLMTPAGAPGTYEGQLTGGDIWLTDAPAVAALLSALSVVGLLEQMSGNGIHFSDVNARFRLGPDRLTLYSSSAVGASMGISMDGYYHLPTKQMDMQGVVSPLYAVNAIGAMLTRRGEGLVGVNYTLRGPAAAPSVGVNPLSLFTPGMFRELFRRSPPQPPTRSAPQGGQEAVPPPIRKPMDRGNVNR
ncbi:AsmA-like C-terminal region-containing protein [Roseovarius dicentrarchi]|uniref:AsmA-like C-terminal region-containing protein n=1 Tax=Roseovarius dicentrarchi TaxID=2250573 RepID=UPI000DE94C3B|nr:AsmA-like C-terminal region-containing protein [Roseovarius dicentrarchi]